MNIPVSEPSGLPILIVNRLVKNMRRWVLIVVVALAVLVVAVAAAPAVVLAAAVPAVEVVAVAAPGVVAPALTLAPPLVPVLAEVPLSLGSCTVLWDFQLCRILRS